MRASSWVRSGTSGVMLRGPSTSTADGPRSRKTRCTCRAQAGEWCRTGSTTSSSVTRRDAMVPTSRDVRAAVVVTGGVARSAVELAAGLEQALPLPVPAGAFLDHDVEVVAQLRAVLRVVLEHGADQLAGDVLP